MHAHWLDEERRQKPILDVSMGRLVWLEQTHILDIFKTVPYAMGERDIAWNLPGKGKAYADCGLVKVEGCTHAEAHPNGLGFGRKYKRSCARKVCPECFEAWASKEGMRALIRFAGYLSSPNEVQCLIDGLKYEKRKEARSVILNWITGHLEGVVQFSRVKIKHVVVSPSKANWHTRNGYARSRSQAYRVARSRGIKGGCMIAHPYRLMCAHCGHKPIPDYKKECPDCGSTDFAWYLSPHFHIVGFGWVTSTKEGYEKDGWVVKNCGIRLSVFMTLQYLLSHAGVSWTHTTTWFGSMAYNKTPKSAELGRVQEHCPICDRILEPLVWIGGEDRGPPKLEFCKGDPTLNDFSFALTDWGRLSAENIKGLMYVCHH